MKFLIEISTFLSKNYQKEKSLILLKDILMEYENAFENLGFKKTRILMHLISELSKQGMFSLALDLARDIEWARGCAMKEIALELNNKGDKNQVELVLKEAINITNNITEFKWKSLSLKDIAIIYLKIGDSYNCDLYFKDALKYADYIKDINIKDSVLYDIAIAQINLNKFKDALKCSELISDEFKVDILKSEISINIAKQFKIYDSFFYINSVIHQNIKCKTLLCISTDLFKNGNIKDSEKFMNKSINCASLIHQNIERDEVFKKILIESAKQRNFEMSEKLSLEITNINERLECWKQIGENISKEIGVENALKYRSILVNKQFKSFYLIGCTNHLSGIDKVDFTIDDFFYIKKAKKFFLNKKYLNEILQSVSNEDMCIISVLRNHALYELFFENISQEKIDSFNKVLNLQWAIDLKKELDQLPN